MAWVVLYFVARKWLSDRRRIHGHFKLNRSILWWKNDREVHVFYRLYGHGVHDKKKTIIAYRRNHLRLRKAWCGPCAGCQRYSACVAHRESSQLLQIRLVYYILHWRKKSLEKKRRNFMIDAVTFENNSLVAYRCVKNRFERSIPSIQFPFLRVYDDKSITYQIKSLQRTNTNKVKLFDIPAVLYIVAE